MRIGIDARFYRESGIGRYLQNLLDELQNLDRENEYFIFLLKKDYESLEFASNFHKVEANFGWYGGAEQLKFPPLLNEYNLDLVHCPHFNVPVFYQGKFVVTIHDLTHHDFKMKRASTHNGLIYEVKHQVHKLVMGQAINKSEKIITVSEFVKNELIKRWNVAPSKVVVTPEAASDKLISIAQDIKQPQIQKVLEKFNIKPPFVFYVGNAHPHKNIEGLIESFVELRKKYQYLQLVLSGKKNYFWEQILKRVQNDKKMKDIIYTDFITDEELVALYKSAEAYVFPSFSEGFGIPMLEAMACGCPVIASNITSLPEVGGDAAVYFDPKSTGDIVNTILSVLNDQKLKKQLIEKGQERYKEFSWGRMAKQTLMVYNSLL